MKAKRTFNPAIDDQNWQTLFDTHYAHLQSLNAISEIWSSGHDKLDIDHSKRPLAEDLTAKAKAHTGFSFIQTDDHLILDQIDWYSYIADREMPMTCFLRTPEELGYCDEPDIWHDIMGHVPFLMEEKYAKMYTDIANMYITAHVCNDEQTLRRLDFIGGMLIELGLIREPSGIKAFGATFYSSSEVGEAFKSENQLPFTFEAMDSGERYDRHSFQGKYYVLESFDQLLEAIERV